MRPSLFVLAVSAFAAHAQGQEHERREPQPSHVAPPRRAREPVAFPLSLEYPTAASMAKRATTSNTVPLSDEFKGKMLVMPVQVGTPPQTIKCMLRLDMQEIIMFPRCGEAFNCSSLGRLPEAVDAGMFKPTDSSTYKDTGVKVVGDSPLAGGSLFIDTVAFGSDSRQNQSTILDGLPPDVGAREMSLYSSIGGIVGLAPWGVGPDPPALKDGEVRLESTVDGDNRPLWKYLADEVWQEGVFGLWLYRAALNLDLGWNAVPNVGQIMFGGLNKHMYTGEINYLPVASVPAAWSVTLGGMSVGGVNVDLSTTSNYSSPAGIDMRLDSYSWMVVLPGEVIPRLVAAIPGAGLVNETAVGGTEWGFLGGDLFSHVFRVPCNSTANVTLTFGGVEYTMTPLDYKTEVATDLCLSRIAGWGLRPLLGTAFLQTVYTAFRSDPLSVGFATVAPDAADWVSVNASAAASGDTKGSAAVSAALTRTWSGGGLAIALALAVATCTLL